MSDTAIRVEGLGKRYQIGGTQARYKTIRESIMDGFRAPFRRTGRLVRGQASGASELDQTIWALRDVSFEVKQGEVVGIIGRNGAGKSTLLKILARITDPTEGEVMLRGRVGSLLEVGTGFHPELTGRENVYLSGVILGMKRVEIERKFDEIVDFSEVSQFIDTPVKHYSSGMYLRLAFGVAANLEPSILLVDEVLAVGDIDFQRKCLGKMGDAAREGRTVFLVSHNMGAIASLTERCLMIDNGTIETDGPTTNVIEHYQARHLSAITDPTDLSAVERYGTGRARFLSVRISALNVKNKVRPVCQTGGDLQIELAIEASDRMSAVNVALIIYDSSGYRLIDANLAMKNSEISLLAGQVAHVTFHLRDLLLKPGSYYVGLWLGRSGEDIDGISYASSLIIEPNPDLLVSSKRYPGVYQVRFSQESTIQEAGGSRTDGDVL